MDMIDQVKFWSLLDAVPLFIPPIQNSEWQLPECTLTSKNNGEFIKGIYRISRSFSIAVSLVGSF